ncbi:MAG TPA: type II CAAX endopeptidase family protein [Chitinophagaceae bacterium]|nr:type II CAAX endopeptidase family protein [Chitinophagaceae bacterium]
MNDSLPAPSRKLSLYGILFSLAVFLLVTLGYGVVMKPFNLSPASYFFISRLVFWLCLAAVFGFTLKVEKQPLLWWKEPRETASFYFVSFFGVLSVVFFGSIAIAAIIKFSGLSTTSKVVERLLPVFGKNTWLMVFTCLTAGVVEEFFFRGYLMPRLQLLVKRPALVIIISSALFGAFHFGYGTVGNMVVPFFIGAVFASYYYYYKSLWVLVCCHVSWDIMVILSAIALSKMK